MSNVPQTAQEGGDGAQPIKKSWRDVLPTHPAADLFPMMSPEQLAELGEDIKAHGLISPIIVWSKDASGEQVLLDGRNRLEAMLRAGILAVGQHCPKGALLYTKPDGDRDSVPALKATEVDPFEFVISTNIHRRHLTAEQRRELITNLLKLRPGQSNRQVAKQVKADQKTVGAVREKLEQRGEIPHVEARSDAIGRQQPSTKATKRKRRDVDDFLAEKRKRETAEPDIVDRALALVRAMSPQQERRFFAELYQSAAFQRIKEIASPKVVAEQPADQRATAAPFEMPDIPPYLRRTS